MEKEIKQLKTERDNYKDRLECCENLIKKVKDCRDIQAMSGNWDYDEYMRGMYNGLELAVSILDNEREPKYRDAPKS